MAYEGLINVTTGAWNGNIKFVESHLLDPLKWKKPRRIFVNSMSDLFHENVTDEMRDRIFAVMALCPQHTFQALTKRAQRMLAYLKAPGVWDRIKDVCSDILAERADKDIRALSWDLPAWPLPNVWLGVSVENQKAADERIPFLLQTPAAVRFLSCEPLLGQVSIRWFGGQAPHPRRIKQMPDVERNGKLLAGSCDEYDGLRMLDWVIAGGESGPGARPMHPDWARKLRDECKISGVPFFFKQWGAWAPGSKGGSDCMFGSEGHILKFPFNGSQVINDTYERMSRVGKKSAGHLLDGVEHHVFPEAR